MDHSRRISVLYAAVVTTLSLGTSLLLITSFDPPRDEGVLPFGLVWMISWFFSSCGLFVVYRLRVRWISAEPIWLQAGLIPVLALSLGIVSTVLGAAVLWLLAAAHNLVRAA